MTLFVKALQKTSFFLVGFSRRHHNARFSTYDHYATSINCPQLHSGSGWWYHSGLDCAHVQLNGRLATHSDGLVPFNTGILWIGWKGDRHYSFQRVHMAIQPKSRRPRPTHWYNSSPFTCCREPKKWPECFSTAFFKFTNACDSTVRSSSVNCVVGVLCDCVDCRSCNRARTCRTHLAKERCTRSDRWQTRLRTDRSNPREAATRWSTQHWSPSDRIEMDQYSVNTAESHSCNMSHQYSSNWNHHWPWPISPHPCDRSPFLAQVHRWRDCFR